jgi:steroid 5-alpha reductase family enzyme
VLKVGEDARFENIKKSFTRFLMTWTLQGLWVSFTLAAALAAVTVTQPGSYGTYDLVMLIIGGIVWILGFFFESVGDYQKNRFRANPENKGKFITSGLWSITRHPNYFGEIVIWFGMMLIALPTFFEWRFVALISPIYVFLQLTLISGVRMLEKRADEKWGGQEEYEEYKRNTSVLIPWLKFKK